MPYIPHIVTINSGSTLTIEPGTTLKFSGSTSRFNVSGTLDAQGTALDPIYFTSLKDDAADGHNTDGATSTPASGDWREINVNSGGETNLEHSIVRYGGASGSGSSRANIRNDGGELTIGTSTVSHGGIYGIRQNSGTTTVEESVIRDNGTYGAFNSVTATSTFTAINNFWNATSGPSHSALNPSGEGELISSYISFDPWLGNQNYLLGYDSVNAGHIQWQWASSSTQIFANELEDAIATWNDLNEVHIIDAVSTVDLEINEIDEPNEEYAAWYDINQNPDTIFINKAKFGNLPSVAIQMAITHELGHALGLHHSYWENTMFLYVTTQTTLGKQDVEDYTYLWGN